MIKMREGFTPLSGIAHGLIISWIQSSSTFHQELKLRFLISQLSISGGEKELYHCNNETFIGEQI